MVLERLLEARVELVVRPRAGLDNARRGREPTAGASPGPAPRTRPLPPRPHRAARAAGRPRRARAPGERSTSPIRSACIAATLLEVALDRLLGTPEAELEVAERLHGPDSVEAGAEFLAQGPRLDGVPAACRLSPLTGREPGEACERGGVLGSLTRLARKPDRLAVARLSGRPLIGRRLVACEVVQQRRRAHRAPSGCAPARTRSR